MKNILKPLVASLAAVLTLTSVCASSAYADTSDTDWSTSNEYWRYKNGSTSVYVYNQGGKDARVSIYGEYQNYGYLYGNVSTIYYPGGGYSTHSTTYLLVQAGQQCSIRQYIHELQYSYAHLVVGNVDGYTHGVWSPDSTQDYYIIN